MKEISAWQTDDGRIFDNYDSAQEHERAQNGLHLYKVTVEVTGVYSKHYWAVNEDAAKEMCSGDWCPEDLQFEDEEIVEVREVKA